MPDDDRTYYYRLGVSETRKDVEECFQSAGIKLPSNWESSKARFIAFLKKLKEGQK